MGGICFRRALKIGASGLAIVATAANAGALPGSGHFVAGKGEIGRAGQSLTVKQSSTAGIINWNSFSIGRKNSVTFANGDGATLNRVTGGNLSRIAGSLHATGSLFLMNNAGVIVSGTGKVLTGGSFTAASDADDRRFKAGSGNVINKGTIIVGGTASLIGRNVDDNGVIRASSADLSARRGALSISGSIIARNKDGSGGTVTARAHTIIIGADGAIDASASAANRSGGTVRVVARHTATIAGSIDAKGGSAGGSIETSGARVHITDGAIISTLAASGEDGTWLIDPKNFTVAATGGDITGAELSSELANNDVVIHNSDGRKSGKGNVFVKDAVTWSAAHTLTLDADHNVAIEAAISGANLVLSTTSGNINIKRHIVMTQDIDLVSGEGIYESAHGTISADNLSGYVTIDAILDGKNAVTRISDFTGAKGFGGIELTDYETLTVAGNVTGGFSGVSLTTKGDGHDIVVEGTLTDTFHNEDECVTVNSAGTLSEAGEGKIAAFLLVGKSTGGMTLNGINHVKEIGSLVNQGAGGFAMLDESSITWMDDGIWAGSGDLTLNVTGSSKNVGFGNSGKLVAKGTVTLSASGNIDEGQFGGSIQGSTVTATAGGNISLAGDNDVAVLDALTAGGSITFDNDKTLTVSAPLDAGSSELALSAVGTNADLVIDASLTGDTVHLGAERNVVQDTGIITANQLTASGGNVTLNADNEINNLMGGGATGTFAITDATTLTMLPGVIGSASIEASNIDLTTVGAGHNIILEGSIGASDDSSDGQMNLNSAGTIEQKGRYARLGADIFQATTHGGASLLGNQNGIATLASFSNTDGGNLDLAGVGTITGLVSNDSGNVRLASEIVELPLVINGEVETSGTLNLLGKYIEEEIGGSIVAHRLTANATGFLGIGSTLNQIGELGKISSEDEVYIGNSSALKVEGVIKSQFDDIDLVTANGGIKVDNALRADVVDLTSAGGITEGAGGLIVSSTQFSVDANDDVTLNRANQVGSLYVTLQGAHTLEFTDDEALSLASASGSGANLVLTTTGGMGITIGGQVSVGTLTLSSAAGIGESTSAAILAATLTGSAAGAVDLNSQGNAIAAVSDFSTGGNDFSLTNAAALETVGTIDAGQGTVTITTTGTGSDLSVDGTVSGSTVNLTTSGAATENSAGAIVTGTLNVVAYTGITLTSSNNAIGAIGTDQTNSGPNQITQ